MTVFVPAGRRILADEEAKEAKLRQESENRAVAMVIKASAAKAQEEREEAEMRLQEQHRELVADIQSQRDRPTLAKQEVARKHRTNAREMRQEMSEREAEVPPCRLAHVEPHPLGPTRWVLCPSSSAAYLSRNGAYSAVLPRRPLWHVKRRMSGELI